MELSPMLPFVVQQQTTIVFRNRITGFVNDQNEVKEKMPIVNRYVQSLCGLYSRVARQLKVDRSYVSRVARGERHSVEVERALNTEFERIMGEGEGRAA
jgi:hypothetical protein